MLIFDGDCGFCSSCVDVAKKYVNPEMQYLPYQRAELTPLGLTTEQCAQAVMFRDTQGHWHSGSAAIGRLLLDSGAVWRPLGALIVAPGMRVLAETVYRVVARYRHRLPGGTPACQRLT